MTQQKECSVELELQRLDLELLKLHPKIQEGDITAIQAALQVSDRRVRLLGLGNPTDWQIQRGIEAGLQVELRAIFDVLEQVLDAETFRTVLGAIAKLESRSDVDLNN